MLYWPKPTLPVWGSVIDSVDVAAAVRCDDMDNDARRRVAVAKADATRVG